MKKWKIIFLAFLLFFSYLFLFFYDWGIYLSLILLIIFLIFPFIKIGGKINLNYLNNFKEKQKMKKYKNFVPEKDATIAICLSGGVDSSVSAYLLKKQGYKLKAFFMRNWDSTLNNEENLNLNENEICEQEKDYNDAKKVADQLGIELIKLNFVNEYWDFVFKRFLNELEEGLTPNPDIFCNKYIKFDHFVKYISKNFPEIDYIATGHYAKIKIKEGKAYLFKAKDEIKDQTYFLSEINKDVLNKLFFPLANKMKSEVRSIAKEANLYTKDKKDSTGICFIGKRNFSSFIENYFKKEEGNIIDEKSNKIIGKHQGVKFYTIGQRRGLGLSGFNEPYFVSNKNIKNNILYVSYDTEKYLYKNKLKTNNFKFLTEEDILSKNKQVRIKTRHSEIIYNGIIKSIEKKDDLFMINLETKEKIKAITPGQEVVIYDHELCVGGGQIAN
ncbi:MAG: tRNA-specific 2-thiouridylase MnmA [Candidatus Hepatoplasma vulgare]|nr:MAG: tRNA-specific 2-thiouridylase MnmA [Candidatus Hepatoplasma sp.]